MHVRVCVDCGEEYRPEIVACADCGGELVDRHGEGEAARPPAADPIDGDDVPDAEFTETVGHAEKARDLTAEADRLVEAGIPFRMRPATRGAGYRLLVAASDSDRALTVLGLLAEHDGDGARACPACDTPVEAGVAECPECGLGVGGDPGSNACEKCGRSLDGPQCPDCGH